MRAVSIVVVGLSAASAWIAQHRQREAALRVALGADRRSVAILLAGRGLLAVVLGLFVGWLATRSLGALIGSELHGVAASDLTSRLVVTALLFSVSAVAMLRPVWRVTAQSLAGLLRSD